MTTPLQSDVAAARHPSGPRHRSVEWNAEQVADYRRRLAVELAGRQENVDYFRKLETAAKEPGFSGDLRRAIAASLIPPEDLGRQLGIDEKLFDHFCMGEATLTSEAIDKIVERLGLRLMQTIS